MIRKPAIFLDRDGVLTVEKGYVVSVEQLEIFHFSKQAVKLIHEAGFYAIVISNQSAVARGMMKISDLEEMNQRLIDEVGVDAVYCCPHHSMGVVEPYACECNCRKPKAGMIEKACTDILIDFKHSFVVGDRATDIELGKRLGLKTVMIKSKYFFEKREKNVEPEYIYEDLLSFAKEVRNLSCEVGDCFNCDNINMQ